MRALTAAYGLHGITATAPAERITAVVGANGAGKSTLLGVIAGVLPVVSGSVEVACARPALVTQHSEVSGTLPLTVRAAVSMGRWAHRGPWRRLSTEDRRIVAECMERLEIGDLAGRQLGTLSGGQRQRALVAQGLAQRASLLLLDEPAAGLDLAARRLIDDALAAARADGVTILRVTHDLAVAEAADHCLLLRDGRLVAAGPPEEVLTQDNVSTAWGVPRLTARA
ncbi:metal ABC transporter ATP-binding protein [Amycolatopsis suaedae]|uniref:Metal ABC transporter ATP-binding protein n=1 Tax=Amycolatopsis suaedae TaxID=2510978 RepID=A0A4Q7J5X7_9PSEU|nr:metal ABC transporter ATP-binding protein [Amycolatopsis suaedae]